MAASLPLYLFITYSREDFKYLTYLERHLNLLVHNGTLKEVWSDGKINPGADWSAAIKSKLINAEVILLLISVDFFDSEYIEKEELIIAFQRHEKGSALVIPILIRACHWKSHYQVQSLQVLPRNNLPVENWVSQDQAFTEIVQEIEAAVLEFSKKKYAYLERELNRANELYSAKQYNEAFKIFIQYLPTGTELDREAAHRMGNYYFLPLGSIKQDYESARYWFEIAAKYENPKGQNNLGILYLRGLGVTKDLFKAAQYFFSASERGLEQAQSNLADMFLTGNGIQPNEEEAFRLYMLSAQKGMVNSQFQLGKMLMKGIGVKKNVSSAIEWIQRAADQGYADAQAYLSATYLDEVVPDVNFSNARYWADKAAQQQHSGGFYLMGIIYRCIGMDLG